MKDGLISVEDNSTDVFKRPMQPPRYNYVIVIEKILFCYTPFFVSRYWY